MDNGGATGYTFVETQKEYAKDLANKLEKLSDGNIGKLPPKELVSTVFECFEFMGNVAELVNRYAAYKTSREHGRSIDRSINDAKEVSVNFNKKGAGKKTKSDNGILTQRRGYLSMEEIGCCSLTPPFKACIRNIPC